MGETLRHAREDQDLTLEQVSRALHIRIRFLTALEASDLRALPSLAQSRGFLRMYAEHLGLDPVPLLARWQPVDRPLAPVEGSAVQPEKPAKRGLSLKRMPGKTPRPESTPPRPGETPDASAEMTHSGQIFKTIAERLVRQREALEMTLEDAATISRIKPQTLSLLEGMDLDQLPSTVIVRGLLLNYAEVLQMDSDEILSLFADALQARRDERNLAARGKKTGHAAEAQPLITINPAWLKKINWKQIGDGIFTRFPFLKKYLTFDLLAGSILVFVLVGVIIWATASTLSLTAEQVASQATLPGPSEILSSGGTQAGDMTADQSATPTSEASPATDTNNGAAPPIAAAQATYLVTLPANADAAFRVTLRPLQTAFVQIWVDDRLAFRGRISPGADYPFNATRRVELLTGDASALRVLFNATDLGIMGISGEVVHLIYTVRGPQTITPTVTSTYTPTPRPTATPRPSATTRPTTTKKPTLTPQP